MRPRLLQHSRQVIARVVLTFAFVVLPACLTERHLPVAVASGPTTGAWADPFSMEDNAAVNIQSAVWTGADVLLWDAALKGLIRFRPDTKAWLPLGTPPEYHMQVGDTAVWSGDELLVWGGLGCQGEGEPCGAGAIFDTRSNSWRTMTVAGAPKPRKAHIAAWVGKQLVIWGGGDTSGLFADGARYEPISNTWRLMAPSPLAATSFAASVVVNDRLFIWGGSTVNGLSSAGAIYDPGADSWKPITSAGAPSARSTSAVWTGTKVIVWGGIAGGASPQRFGDGAAYDPTTDQWSPISQKEAPSARGGHVLLWTGSKMVVWSGIDAQGNDRNDGAIYDPVTDSWIGMATEGAPTPRGDGWGFWTGDRMLAFGGSNGHAGAASADGAFFTP